jgi:hydrogenase nickel incorporation protein HypA/HybF
MHELSVTQSVLSVALRYAEEAGATRITDLYLVIGELSSIVDDSLQFYWDIVGKDTIAEGARLHFRRTPGRLRCLTCNTEFDIADRYDFTCPHCGGQQTQIAGGDEFQLESIEIATDEEEVAG